MDNLDACAPRTKDKVAAGSIWQGILQVTDDVCEEFLRHGILVFEGKAPTASSGKHKRTVRWDSGAVADHAARCAAMCFLMDPSRVPSVLDKNGTDAFVDMWECGTDREVVA